MLNRKNRWLWTAPAALLLIALSSAPYARAVALADAPAAKAGSPKKLSFEQACFLNWRSGNGLNQEQARQILEPVPGQSFQLTDGPNAENRLAVTWTGMARLRAQNFLVLGGSLGVEALTLHRQSGLNLGVEPCGRHIHADSAHDIIGRP